MVSGCLLSPCAEKSSPSTSLTKRRQSLLEWEVNIVCDVILVEKRGSFDCFISYQMHCLQTVRGYLSFSGHQHWSCSYPRGSWEIGSASRWTPSNHSLWSRWVTLHLLWFLSRSLSCGCYCGEPSSRVRYRVSWRIDVWQSQIAAQWRRVGTSSCDEYRHWYHVSINVNHSFHCLPS